MKWCKPNGNEITTNDDKETIAYCESLGWKETTQNKGLPSKQTKDKVTKKT